MNTGTMVASGLPCFLEVFTELPVPNECSYTVVKVRHIQEWEDLLSDIGDIAVRQDLLSFFMAIILSDT